MSWESYYEHIYQDDMAKKEAKADAPKGAGYEWCENCGEDPPVNEDGYCPECVIKLQQHEPPFEW